MEEVMLVKKENIFKLLSLVGMALGAVGTLLSSWADDKELDRLIDEKIDKRLTTNEEEEESEES